MSKKERRPRWGWLYALIGLTAATFFVEGELPLTRTVHIVAQLAILGLATYFVVLWNESNFPFDPWS